jgi:hypothetical protein
MISKILSNIVVWVLKPYVLTIMREEREGKERRRGSFPSMLEFAREHAREIERHMAERDAERDLETTTGYKVAHES